MEERDQVADWSVRALNRSEAEKARENVMAWIDFNL